MSFQGKLIDEAPKDEAPKDKAPTTTPSRTARKKDTPPCYCGAVHWFQDCPYINESVRSKDWKSDKATAKKVEEKIANASDWTKSKIEKIRKQASGKEAPEKEAARNPDGSQKEDDSTFAVH